MSPCNKLTFTISLDPHCCGRELPRPKNGQEEVICPQCKKQYAVEDILRQIKALARKKV